MRQHVNPLSKFYQEPLELPNVNNLFEKNDLPIHLDIGSARGKFLLKMASHNNDWNYVGVEIRKPLVISAKKQRDALDLKNLDFFFCNANVSLERWIVNLKRHILRRVSIQFPDPWFKRRHFKRRVLQPELLLAISKSFLPESELFIQSDVYSIIKPMTELIEESNFYRRVVINKNEWLKNNPFDGTTEREQYAIKKNLPIYRALYIRNNIEIGK